MLPQTRVQITAAGKGSSGRLRGTSEKALNTRDWLKKLHVHNLPRKFQGLLRRLWKLSLFNKLGVRTFLGTVGMYGE